MKLKMKYDHTGEFKRFFEDYVDVDKDGYPVCEVFLSKNLKFNHTGMPFIELHFKKKDRHISING